MSYEDTTPRYFLARDDSAHWYVIPVSQAHAFATWANGDYEDDPEPPEGVWRCDGWPGRVTFTDPREDA